jgi:hypothetical protein
MALFYVFTIYLYLSTLISFIVSDFLVVIVLLRAFLLFKDFYIV